MKITEEENKLRYDLYFQGYTDSKIAEIVGAYRAKIADWRRQRGLPNKNKDVHRVSEDEDKKRMELYKRGLSDNEIAKKTGRNISAIFNWRNKKRLPPNFICNAPLGSRPNFCKRVKMEDALTAEQCRVMRHFLQSLVLYYKHNPKPIVENFIRQYREYRAGAKTGRGHAM